MLLTQLKLIIMTLLITKYTQLENKAKRPIIEFYPNIKLFNSE
jgi:hypothetical protein